MTSLLLSLLAAAPAPPNPVTYTCTRDAEPKCEVTDWSKQPRVFTATHDAPVHERPERSSPVTAKLRFGVPVKILNTTPPALETVDGRSDRWYRVASEGKAGYLFGDVLTHARFEEDFDADGDLELATVAFTTEKQIRVRFWDPKDQRETFVDVQPAGGAYVNMHGGHAYANTVKKSVAGLPLVHVDTHVEACADLADYWVSYVGSVPRVALELGGLVDPPTMATYKVEFQPAKRRAVVKREHVEQEDAPPVKRTETWTLDGGVFVNLTAPAE